VKDSETDAGLFAAACDVGSIISFVGCNYLVGARIMVTINIKAGHGTALNPGKVGDNSAKKAGPGTGRQEENHGSLGSQR
jgi:hypothetical protein